MNSRFDHLTKGLLSLAVILMFAAALVADQARANLTDDAAANVSFVEKTRTGVILNGEMLRRIDSLPSLVGSVFALPSEVDLCLDVLRPGTSDARRDDSSVN